MASMPNIVVVYRDAAPGQMVRKVTVNGHEVLCQSLSLHRGIDGPPLVTLVLPADYLEVDPE